MRLANIKIGLTHKTPPRKRKMLQLAKTTSKEVMLCICSLFLTIYAKFKALQFQHVNPIKSEGTRTKRADLLIKIKTNTPFTIRF